MKLYDETGKFNGSARTETANNIPNGNEHHHHHHRHRIGIEPSLPPSSSMPQTSCNNNSNISHVNIPLFHTPWNGKKDHSVCPHHHHRSFNHHHLHHHHNHQHHHYHQLNHPHHCVPIADSLSSYIVINGLKVTNGTSIVANVNDVDVDDDDDDVDVVDGYHHLDHNRHNNKTTTINNRHHHHHHHQSTCNIIDGGSSGASSRSGSSSDITDVLDDSCLSSAGSSLSSPCSPPPSADLVKTDEQRSLPTPTQMPSLSTSTPSTTSSSSLSIVQNTLMMTTVAPPPQSKSTSTLCSTSISTTSQQHHLKTLSSSSNITLASCTSSNCFNGDHHLPSSCLCSSTTNQTSLISSNNDHQHCQVKSQFSASRTKPRMTFAETLRFMPNSNENYDVVENGQRSIRSTNLSINREANSTVITNTTTTTTITNESNDTNRHSPIQSSINGTIMNDDDSKIKMKRTITDNCHSKSPTSSQYQDVNNNVDELMRRKCSLSSDECSPFVSAFNPMMFDDEEEEEEEEDGDDDDEEEEEEVVVEENDDYDVCDDYDGSSSLSRRHLQRRQSSSSSSAAAATATGTTVEYKRTTLYKERKQQWLDGMLTDLILKTYTHRRQPKSLLDYKCTLQELITRCLAIYLNGGDIQFKIYLIGSSLTSIGSSRSDIDLCMVIYDRETGRVDERYNNRIYAELLLNKICVILEKSGLAFQAKVIPANVPILKFFDQNHIEVNLNLNKLVTVQNTMLLVHLCSLDSRVAPFLFIVKLWAQKNGINCAYFKSLSSYALSLMAIFFLQNVCQPTILPSFNELVDYVIKSTSLFQYQPDGTMVDNDQSMVNGHKQMHVTSSVTSGSMSFIDRLPIPPPPPPPPPMNLPFTPLSSTNDIDESMDQKVRSIQSPISKVTLLDSTSQPSHITLQTHSNVMNAKYHQQWSNNSHKRSNHNHQNHHPHHHSKGKMGHLITTPQYTETKINLPYYYYYYYYYYCHQLHVLAQNQLRNSSTSLGSTSSASSSISSDLEHSNSGGGGGSGSGSTSSTHSSSPSYTNGSLPSNDSNVAMMQPQQQQQPHEMRDHQWNQMHRQATSTLNNVDGVSNATTGVVSHDTNGQCPTVQSTPPRRPSSSSNASTTSNGWALFNQDCCDGDDYDYGRQPSIQQRATTTTVNIGGQYNNGRKDQLNGSICNILIDTNHKDVRHKSRTTSANEDDENTYPHPHHHHQQLISDQDLNDHEYVDGNRVLLSSITETKPIINDDGDDDNTIDNDVMDGDGISVSARFKSKNSKSLGTLFADFITYYSDRSIYDSVISVRTGRLMKRTDPIFARSCDTSMDTFICIEEPFNHTNTSHSVHNDFMFNFIVKSFRWTRESIGKMKLSVNDFI